ncbi:MAG: DNA double-strand break repair nuclease NurA [Candidatus Aenigmarchaeota archaeon]|nr:DNA double-strand break repair nuclease NurA [Candidatus Aenigmarchaeota archaeon]
MHELLNQLSTIANRIKNVEGDREKLGKFIKDMKETIKFDCPEVAETTLTVKVDSVNLSGMKVIGIDGGLSQHEYHGMDMILTRAVAAIFNYSDGKLEVDYYPSPIVSPKLTIITDPYDDTDFSKSASLERQKTEIELALEVFNKFNPDLLLLDGSIVPHMNDRAGKDSNASEKYQNVLNIFSNLYKSANGKLAGCVEDSRGRRFCDILKKKITDDALKKILDGTKDTNLLYHILETGERTCVFRLNNDLSNIYSFYIKTAEYDRPVRIDFYADSDVVNSANNIASIVLATSCHDTYGIPTPIIEADCRAKLKEHDVDALHDQLVDMVGITPGLMKLRREQRPL